MSLLLTLLFSFLMQNLKMEQKMEVARSEILARQNLQTKCQDVLTSLSHAPGLPQMYTQLFPKERYDSLVFVFDNGVDPDPLFSGIILGRIYLDGKENLSLVTWPIEEGSRHFWRKEVLLSHVSGFSFQFLGEKKEADPTIKPVTREAGWHPSWPKKRGDLPSLIRLNVHQGAVSLDFAFRLPTAIPIATYWEGGYKP